MFGIEKYWLDRANVDKKSALSEVAFQSIVVHALGSCRPVSQRTDNMGIDMSCEFQWKVGSVYRVAEINVQLKSTSRNLKSTNYKGQECWVLPVDSNQLRRYRAKTNVPLFIILVIFPADEDYEDWLKIQNDSSLLKNKIYWVHIKDAGDAESRVYVPVNNKLDQETLLREIVFPISEGKCYE